MCNLFNDNLFYSFKSINLKNRIIIFCKIPVAVIFFLTVISCNTSEKNNYDDHVLVEYSRSDFNDSTELQGTIGTLPNPDSLSDPVEMRIIRDSILMILNLEADTFLEFYNYNTLELINKCVPVGRGPNELLSCRIEDFNRDSILLKDIVSKSLMILSVDSILVKRNEVIKKQSFPKWTDNIAFYNSKYAIASDWRYFRHPEFDNGLKTRLFKIPFNPDSLEVLLNKEFKFDYFVKNVTHVNLEVNNSLDTIVAINVLSDEVEFYNKNLELIKVLRGPDKFNVNFANSGKGRGVLPTGYFTSFFGISNINNDLFMIYIGRENADDDFKGPVEVFKIGWDGSLIKYYKLDEYGFQLSFNNKGNKLYLSNYHPDIGPKFFEYEIDK